MDPDASRVSRMFCHRQWQEEVFPMSFFDYKLFLLEINPKNRWFVEDVHFPKKHFAGSILIFQRAKLIFRLGRLPVFPSETWPTSRSQHWNFHVRKTRSTWGDEWENCGDRNKKVLDVGAALGPWWGFFSAGTWVGGMKVFEKKTWVDDPRGFEISIWNFVIGSQCVNKQF